jgi:hypothetical protein
VAEWRGRLLSAPTKTPSAPSRCLRLTALPCRRPVRTALIDAARARAQERIRAEAQALAADAVDRAEAAQVLRDMETLRAW